MNKLSIAFRLIGVLILLSAFSGVSFGQGSVYQTTQYNPICIGVDVSFAYSGSCSISWQAEGDATIVSSTATTVTVRWHTGTTFASVIARCSNASMTVGTGYFTVSGGVTPVVSIAGPTSICSGANATYQATATNGGPSPTYNWKVNGVSKQLSTSNTFITSQLALGNVVTVQMTSNAPCISTPTATSSGITIATVTQPPLVKVTIAGPSTYCQGQNSGVTATYTATPENGGSSPTYVWYRNTTAVDDNELSGNQYRPHNPLIAGTKVSCQLTSNLSCSSGSPATSNQITVSIIGDAPTVNIVPTKTSFCVGDQVTFNATSSFPLSDFQWKIDNSVTLNSTASFITSSLSGTNVVYLSAVATTSCGPVSVYANTQGLITIYPALEASFSPTGSKKICSTCSEPLTANPGPDYSYQWMKDAVGIPGAYTLTYSAAQTGRYTVAVTRSACTSKISDVGFTLTVNRLPIVNAGVDQSFTAPVSSVPLTGSATDPDGTPISIVWTQVSGAPARITNGTTLTPTISGLLIGAYTFRLTATDDFDEKAYDEVNITLVAPPNNYNFRKETTLRVPTTNESDIDGLTVAEKDILTTYYDGLARPMQQVGWQASPGKDDVVQPILYDEQGRSKYQHLPVVPAKNDGYYIPNQDIIDPTTHDYKGIVADFYQPGSNNNIADDDRPFSEIVFEESPLDRPEKRFGAGKDWTTNNKYVTDQYLTNVDGTGTEQEQIIVWTLNASEEVIRNTTATLNNGTGYYPTGSLYIKSTIDEQGQQVREYTTKNGKLILKKVQALATVTSLNDVTQWAQTYYVYDNFENLRCVLQPVLVKTLAASTTVNPSTTEMAALAFQYKYDERQRMIEKKMPGAEVVLMAYDDRDRLAMTQDGAQRAKTPREWTVMKYDAHNRLIITGILQDLAYAWDRQFVQTYIDDYYTNLTSGRAWYEERGNDVHGYTSRSFPDQLLPKECLTVTYYDDYDFGNAIQDPSDYSYVPSIDGQPAQALQTVKDKVTGSRVRVLDGEAYGEVQWLTTCTYYDDRYRVIQTVSDNYKGGKDRVSSQFDFSKLLKTKTTHESRAVTWKSLVNVAMQGNKLVKTGGSNGAWDANAISVEMLPANTDGFLEITASEVYLHRMFGFTAQNAGGDPALIVHGLIIGNNELWIGENGLYTPITTYLVGDVLRIERKGTQIFYKRNGGDIRPPSDANPGALYATVSLNSSGSSIAYAKASFASRPVTITRTYDYDHANRMTNLWHQVGTNTNFVIAHSNYNQLGQLIEKRLHGTNATASDAKESIDYTHNIRGWLTSINDPQNNPRLFSETLKYNNPTAGKGGVAQFNGNIGEVIWRNAGGYLQSYGYSYDAMNRLKDARYYNLDKTGRDDRYRETISTPTASNYDLNGNILKLTRNGRISDDSYGIMDELSYTYNGGNQLTRVDDAQADDQGFKELTTQDNEYTYDGNGSLTTDTNKGVVGEPGVHPGIDYTYLNQPRRVTKNATDYVTYVYDATGRKLFQQMFISTGSRRTDYAGEFTYQGDSLKFVSHEEGRVVMTDAVPEYQYFLKDHLGNVRTTFSEKQETDTYATDFEAATNTDFEGYTNQSSFNLFDHTDGPVSTAKTYSQLLNGSANVQVGLAKSLEVGPGDVIDLEVYAKYEGATENPNNIEALVTSLITAFNLSATGHTPLDGARALGAFNSTFSPGPYVGREVDYEDDTAPFAYLNYILFDEDYKMVDFGADQIDKLNKQVDADHIVAHDYLTLHVNVKVKGFLYVYLSNEQPVQTNVYFDDFKMTYKKSAVVQANDYYPFGLTFNSYSRENSVKQDYQYNSKENQDELNLGWLDYGARMYMPDIGRFSRPDIFSGMTESTSPYSYADSDPVNFVDMGGNFKFSDDFSRTYPRVTAWLKEVLPLFQNNQHIINTIAKHTNLGRNAIKDSFRNDKGPTLSPLNPFDSDAWGRTFDIGDIRVNQGNLIELLERGLATNDSKFKDFTDLHKFMTLATILHELIHEGSMRTKFKLPIGNHPDNPDQDEGDNWEIDAFGRMIDRVTKAGGKSDNPRVKDSAESFKGDSPIFFYLFINTAPNETPKKKQTYFKGEKGHGEW